MLKELADRGNAIRERWERLLRLEPVPNALASPDTLVHLMPLTFGSLLGALSVKREPGVTLENARAVLVPACACGRNPYGAYFASGEQAVAEEIVLIQSRGLGGPNAHEELADVIRAFRRLAANEIETFCSVCIQQTRDPSCRLYADAS